MSIPRLPTTLLALSLILTLLIPSCTSAAISVPPTWWSSICRGTTLDLAMRHPHPLPSTYISPPTSAFDGPLITEFAQWGYKESFSSSSCDFDETWGLGHAFEALGLDPRSTARGGPNQCFVVAHGKYDGGEPLWRQGYEIEGKRFRVTAAISSIGVSPSTGHIFFINVLSPSKAAENFWGRKPLPSELPALRAQSDFAWGFWNRMVQPAALGRVTALWSTKVVNVQTRQIIDTAVETYVPEEGQRKEDALPEWPGLTFDVSSVEGLAILGSPNGLGPGFFLAQHKRQFGGSKMISKITVFRSSPVSALPTIIFWVIDVPGIGGGDSSDIRIEGGGMSDNITQLNRSSTTSPPRHVATFSEPRVLKRSPDERTWLREHVMQVRVAK